MQKILTQLVKLLTLLTITTQVLANDYFSQFVMQKETLEFTITYHNGLIKSAQDNLYVGYGTCEVLYSVSADMIVG